tara:strand:+ start:312 stop:2144 length:1833 start_codon:yes stop_codon:yes gene_type:complete
MQVEGGFLDGLDLSFSEGLNVLIGGRGTGKSSIIELIRYCFDVKSNSTEEDASRSKDQALSALEDGQVTLLVGDQENDFVISRSANSAPEGLADIAKPPLIFSQMDVESIGLSARGRLNMLDLFSTQSLPLRSAERKHITQISSLTIEIRNLLSEADQITERLSGVESVKAELDRAEVQAAGLSRTSSQLEQKQVELDQLAKQSSGLTLKMSALQRALEKISSYSIEVSSLELLGFPIDDLPDSFGEEEFLTSAKNKLRQAEHNLRAAFVLLDSALEEVKAAITKVEKDRAPLDEKARVVRREVEGFKEGAGTAARQLAGLREQKEQLDALEALREQIMERARRVQEQRSQLLDELDLLREKRSIERQRAARTLNDNLMPLIHVKVRQAAQLSEFIAGITNALRGSGLRYNELANAFAESMTPRELVEAAENYDAEFISKTAKITIDRAVRIAAYLRVSGTESIATISLDDAVDFELLDGVDFKPMNELSVGQRCTVALSILLQNPDRTLIIDQPEDHLDNAFIVETLIGAIRQRSNLGQLVLSTHNANIPVLGEAEQVVRLASNGRRGFVAHSEKLDHPKSVDAIKTLMEGGEKAFRTREQFYRRFSNE